MASMTDRPTDSNTLGNYLDLISRMTLEFNPPVTARPSPRHLDLSCPVWHLEIISWLSVGIHRDPSEKHGCNPLDPQGHKENRLASQQRNTL